MERRNIFILGLFGLFLFFTLSLVSAGGTATDGAVVYQCGTINTTGSYTMNQSITDNSLTTHCINITSENVSLNCDNRFISSNESHSGIYSNKNNLTINNCNISMGEGTYGYGIKLDGSNNSNIFNTILNNQKTGLFLLQSSNGTFVNITSDMNYDGVSLSGSNNNNFTEIYASNNIRDGMHVESSLNNNFTSIITNFNKIDGIYFSSVSESILNNITSKYNPIGFYLTNSHYNSLSNSTINNNYNSAVSWVFSNNNIFSDIAATSNQKSFTSVISTNSTFVNNKLYYNLADSSMISSTLFGELFERTYEKNIQQSFIFDITYINKTNNSNYNYSISFYPSTPYAATNNSNELTINFTPVKDGIYTLKLNVSDGDNNFDIRNIIFLVGNISSDSIRYYMHSDEPTHGQPPALGIGSSDSGSLFDYPTTIEEERSCSSWVQFSPDKIVNIYPIIKNISIGWFYSTDNSFLDDVGVGIEKYVSYSYSVTHSLNIPPSGGDYVFNTTNFTNLNITSDYAWRFYWLSLKLKAGDSGSPNVISNATQQSYADLTYIYAGPKIEQFSEEEGSDIRETNILSNVFNNDTGDNATLQFEGNGNFTIVLNMTDDNHAIFYDGVNCLLNINCTINSNEGGIINLTLSLGSLHTLDIYTTAEAVAVEETSSSSVGGTPIYYPKQSDLENGYTNLMGNNWKINFEYGDKPHQLKLNSFDFTNKSANITISSDPQTETLFIGEDWKVNLDNDGYYDLLVRLENVTQIRAEVFIQKINESIIVFPNNDEKTYVSETIEDDGWSVWIYSLLGILAILGLIKVAIFFISKQR